jgi:hypothetical protein
VTEGHRIEGAREDGTVFLGVGHGR